MTITDFACSTNGKEVTCWGEPQRVEVQTTVALENCKLFASRGSNRTIDPVLSPIATLDEFGEISSAVKLIVGVL